MNNIIKFFTIIFSVLVLFSCEKKGSYLKINAKQISTESKKKDTLANPHAIAKNIKQEVTYEIIELPENGTSLVTLFTDKESFLGKEIIVKGKVVKVNDGILNRNWVHIADGTGIENKKQLTITTNEFVKVGDIVTFKGVITLNKDFGYGYVYDILLEEGALLK